MQVLEDKANLAYLQLRMTVPVLETYIARCPEEFMLWACSHWPEDISTESSSEHLDWYAVKAAKGNGGKDVWIASKDTFRDIYSELPAHGELVIQK